MVFHVAMKQLILLQMMESGCSKYKNVPITTGLTESKKKQKTLKLESDQVVISNVSKLLAQKKHLTLFLKSNSSHLTLKQFKQEKKQKSIPDDKNSKTILHRKKGEIHSTKGRSSEQALQIVQKKKTTNKKHLNAR